ncbi:SOS response-associated peptidase, partial [Mesorhizobium sp. M2D.F.Ca.ET.145.01.1.1]
MCNDYEQHVAWAEYCRMMASLALKISTRQSD